MSPGRSSSLRRAASAGWLIAACLGLAASSRLPAQQAPGSITGRVLCDGAPVRHARVVLESRPSQVTSTDANGAFRFERLTPGTYMVHAEKPGFLMQGADSIESIRTLLPVDVRPDSPASVDIVFTRAAAIEGTFTTMSGVPVGETSLTVTAERLGNSPGETPVTTARRSYDGRFRVHTLSPGRYRLRISFDSASAADWFFPGTPRAESAQMLTLVAGQSVSLGNVALPLPEPQSAAAARASPVTAGAATGELAGRVVDEFGDPVPWLNVELLQRRFIAGRFRLVPFGWVAGCCESPKAQETDDLGRFTFRQLPAGDYYLVALPEPFGRPSHANTQDGITGLMPQFFPGNEDEAGARPIHVDAGQVAGDITMTLRWIDTGAVAVKVVDEDGEQVQVNEGNLSANLVYAVQREQLVPSLRARPTYLVIRNLPAGEYRFWDGMQPQSILVAPGVTTQVTRRQIARMVPAVTATGMVTFDAPPPPIGSVRVLLQPTDITRALLMHNGVEATVANAWNFSATMFAGVTGVVRVEAPKGWALARVAVNDRDVTDVPANFADGDHITVLLTNRLGTIAGTVLEGGRPSANRGVIVFSDDRAQWAYPSRCIHVAHVDAQGRFELDGILPGRYLAALLPNNIDDGADPESLDAMQSSATRIDVQEKTVTKVVLGF